MSQGQLLYKLQEIELQVLRHQRRLNEIAKLLEENETIQSAQATITLAQQVLKPLQAQSKDLELQVQSTRTKRETTEKRLYSGTVKNPKELTDMQNELTSLNKWIEDLDEQVLFKLLEVEEAQTALNHANQHLSQVTAEWESAHQNLLGEKRDLEVKNKTLMAQRVEAMKPIQPEVLKTYNALRPQKANQPVAMLQEQNCSVCGIEQNQMTVKAVRAGDDLITCSSCRRILVYMG